ncbi:MAG: NADH-quinone oxidoreductase subunit NuoB [Planctomycetes bacterium]|nr:NADH-quinone oxidoreductase subunit NuoB [Planctomycetota bacterium]
MSSKPNLDTGGSFTHPLYQTLERLPGVSLGLASLDDLLAWGLTNSLWVFPMATSCCGIELMAAAASRIDLDRMGTIVRATPRQADVMVVAGTITVKMAPRVLKLWEQMPEPKWCIAMGSCAISGDFYRNLYSVIPGIDTVIPVDVYVPGCPPNPEALMHGLLRLQEKVQAIRRGEKVVRDPNPELIAITKPSVPRVCERDRDGDLSREQADQALRVTADQMCSPIDVPYAATTPQKPVFAPDFAGLLTELGIADAPAEGPPCVPVARHYELTRRLKDLGYRQLVSIVASHWPAGLGRKGKDEAEPEHFEVTYLLRTVGKGSRVATWTVRLVVDETIPTIVPLFAGADWQEREQYDLVGVRFEGHPDLRRLMMAENWVGHPLRRDYPIDTPCAPWR